MVVWAVVRLTVFRGFNAEDLWQAQMGLLQGLLLLDTLLVIWWYADLTASLRRASYRQLVLGQQQFRHALGVERIRHKPFVVAVRTELEDTGYAYFVRNIGPGLAANIWYVHEQPDGSCSKRPLGALGPGDSKRLPDDIDRKLCDHDGLFPFGLAAEGLVTRTAQWTATVNLRQRSRGGEIMSQVFPVTAKPHHRQIDTLLSEQWAELRRALRDAGAGL